MLEVVKPKPRNLSLRPAKRRVSNRSREGDLSSGSSSEPGCDPVEEVERESVSSVTGIIDSMASVGLQLLQAELVLELFSAGLRSPYSMGD